MLHSMLEERRQHGSWWKEPRYAIKSLPAWLSAAKQAQRASPSGPAWCMRSLLLGVRAGWLAGLIWGTCLLAGCWLAAGPGGCLWVLARKLCLMEAVKHQPGNRACSLTWGVARGEDCLHQPASQPGANTCRHGARLPAASQPALLGAWGQLSKWAGGGTVCGHKCH